MNYSKISVYAALAVTPLLLASASAVDASPAITISNPSGFGASAGQIYGGVSYQNLTRSTNISDGDATIGVGIGNADELAVQLEYRINSFGINNDQAKGGLNDGKLGDGQVNVKLHKLVSPSTSVAVGVDNVIQVGTSDAPKFSPYVAATHVIGGEVPIAVTVGVQGSKTVGSSKTVNPFATVGIRVAKNVSVLTEYDGDDLSVGASLAIDDRTTATVGVRDLTKGARVVASVGYSF